MTSKSFLLRLKYFWLKKLFSFSKQYPSGCNRGEQCTYIHPKVSHTPLAPSVLQAIIEAGDFAFKNYYSKPYVEVIPLSYTGERDAYYCDFDPFEGTGPDGQDIDIQRPNHGLASAMRKALLVMPVCESLKFKPEQPLLIAMMVSSPRIQLLLVAL